MQMQPRMVTGCFLSAADMMGGSRLHQGRVAAVGSSGSRARRVRAASRPCRACTHWQHAVAEAPKLQVGAIKPLHCQTYACAGMAFVLQVGSALLDLGVKPKDRVGVIGANCPEWMLTMQGCNRTRCAQQQRRRRQQS